VLLLGGLAAAPSDENYMVDKEIIVRESSAGVVFSPEDVETIKNTVAKDATASELKLFLMQCKRTGLDPFSRQIYFLKMGGKASIQSSIDGFRLIAERSGKYQGQTIPLFLDEEGKWYEVWTGKGYPVAAKVGVLRSDFKEPLYGIAKWDSYAPIYNGQVGAMWKKMPDLMLSKVAEALALRKAFPNDLSGIYASEEMSQVRSSEEYDNSEVPEDTEPIVTQDNEEAPASLEEETGQEIPRDIVGQKRLIMAKAKVKWPDLDLKDAKAIRGHIADYTELELVESNYPAIIKALS
jgi:phage recombination protein Bet